MSLHRRLWIAVGCAAVALGVIGIALPLLPTTPFLLLAAFAFARSSPRLHAWLVDHPRLGPPIQNWRREGAISRHAKALALLAMLGTLGLSVAAGLPTTPLIIQAIALLAVAVFIITRPAPSDDGPSNDPS